MGRVLNKKIIHVMIDEKFNDMAISQFELAMPNVHEYWVVSKNIRMTKSSLVKRCSNADLSSQLNRFDVAGVVFHSLPFHHYGLLEKIDSDKTVVWIGWGYDYYPLLRDEDESSRIMSKTAHMAIKPNYLKLRSKASSLFAKMRGVQNSSISALNRVDFFSPVLDSEFELVRKHISIKAEYIEWNYGTVEDDLSLPNGAWVNGQNILVGNSATDTNNHVEIFESIIDQVNIIERKIIVPLSYGESYYRERVIKLGLDMFGERFVPLTNFMPLDQYTSTIQTCGFVMMNHLRQQAMGNIVIALHMGAKVYINKGSPLVSWLMKRGVIFGLTDNLDMKPLNENDRKNNREIMYSNWGREIQAIKTRRLVDTILRRFQTTH